MEITDQHIEQFIAAAHKVGDRNLTRCSSGNLSWRIGDLALVSATGSWVPELRAGQVSICKIATGEWINGVKPSMESTFHLTIMRNRPDVNVVLHCQSIYATTVACMKNKPTNFNLTAELPCHCGSDIAIIPTIVRALRNWHKLWLKQCKTMTPYYWKSMVRYLSEKISMMPSRRQNFLKWPVKL